MNKDQIYTSRFVVSDGIGHYLGHDAPSGGYPWSSNSLYNATIYIDVEKALEGVEEAIGHYVRWPYAGVFKIVLEQVDLAPEIEKIQHKKRQEELARIKKNIEGLRPEDIAYIKANL